MEEEYVCVCASVYRQRSGPLSGGRRFWYGWHSKGGEVEWLKR